MSALLSLVVPSISHWGPRMRVVLCKLLLWVLRLYVWAARRPLRRLRDGQDPGLGPYIDRWFLTNTPKGDETGTPGWYLQRIHRADADPRLHCHPWVFGRSLILDGGYWEARHDPWYPCEVRYELHSAGDVNVLHEDDWHRIIYVDAYAETWTLFYAGAKHGRGWGFR